MPYLHSPLEIETFDAIETATVKVIDGLGRESNPVITKIVTGAVNFVLKNDPCDQVLEAVFVEDDQPDPVVQELVGIVADHLVANHLEADHVVGDEPLLRLLRITYLWDVAGRNRAA